MTDPFQDVSGADPSMIGIIVDALEARAEDPQMLPIIDAYLAALDLPMGGLLLEIGAGTGGVSRRIARTLEGVRIVGVEPSPHLVDEARHRAQGIANLSFEVGDGAALAREDASVDAAVLHTVLTHVPHPEARLTEAFRVLRPGGQVVICDADFSKLALGNVEGDPLEACAVCLRSYFVTNVWITAAMRRMVVAAGFAVDSFTMANRLDLGGGGARSWVRMAGAYLTSTGVIGRDLAAALEREYERRSAAGLLYGFMPFATLIGRKP